MTTKAKALEAFIEFKKKLETACCPPCGISLGFITNHACVGNITVDELRERTKKGWRRQSEDLDNLKKAASELEAVVSQALQTDWQDETVAVTDIHCTCGIVHSFAGKSDSYLGATPLPPAPREG